MVDTSWFGVFIILVICSAQALFNSTGTLMSSAVKFLVPVPSHFWLYITAEL
jgi:hypothetical protein